MIRWTGVAPVCFKRRTLPRQESCTLTVLPVSPDKAAVLLLLARNECVGVSSLLTMLLSHGLSCRRRARRHHISKMLEEFSPGGKGGGKSIIPIASICQAFKRRGSPGRTAGIGSGRWELCPKEELVHKVAFLQDVKFVMGSTSVLWVQILPSTLL